jgi:hypothetical protein
VRAVPSHAKKLGRRGHGNSEKQAAKPEHGIVWGCAPSAEVWFT